MIHRYTDRVGRSATADSRIAPAEDDPHRGAHALVVEDDRVDQMSHRRALVRSGHFTKVTAFSMAADALAWLLRGDDPVDLILLDIHLPGMGGFEFLAALRRDLPDLQDRMMIAAMTSTLSPTEMERLTREPWIAATLDKPLDPAALDALLAGHGRGVPPPRAARPELVPRAGY